MNAMTDPRTALVLFSGGQDSTACLAWALARHARVETIGHARTKSPVSELFEQQGPATGVFIADDHVEVAESRSHAIGARAA